MDINWLLTIALSIIGSIILSVLGNLITDPVKDWLSKRSLVSRTKQVDKLNKELLELDSCYNDRQKLGVALAIKVIEIAMLIIIGLVCMTALISTQRKDVFPGVSSTDMFAITPLIPYYLAMMGGLSIRRLLRRINNFDEYKERTEKRIAELEDKLSSKQITKV